MALSDDDIRRLADASAAATEARLATVFGLLSGRVDELATALMATNETLIRLVNTLAPDADAEGSPLAAVEAALVGLTDAVKRSARDQIAAIDGLVGVIVGEPPRPQVAGGDDLPELDELTR